MCDKDSSCMRLGTGHLQGHNDACYTSTYRQTCVHKHTRLCTWVACVAEHADQAARLQQLQRSLHSGPRRARLADELQGRETCCMGAAAPR